MTRLLPLVLALALGCGSAPCEHQCGERGGIRTVMNTSDGTFCICGDEKALANDAQRSADRSADL